MVDILKSAMGSRAVSMRGQLCQLRESAQLYAHSQCNDILGKVVFRFLKQSGFSTAP